MTIASVDLRSGAPGWAWSLTPARGLTVVLVACAIVAGFAATDHATTMAAVSRDGPDLTRLLRSMAALKLLMAAGATAGVLWRLGSPARPAWIVAYALALAAMWSGPGLIWDMAHLRLGALLLHGGLFGSLVLLWRDPVVGRRLAVLVERRRQALR